MLQLIESPASILVVRAVGKVEKSDYDTVLEPAIQAMLAEKDEVRFVYVLGADFDSYTPGATWEDAKLGLSHISKWKRIAVVTDHDWLHHAVSAFGWMIPGQVRTFSLAEESEAVTWAGG